MHFIIYLKKIVKTGNNLITHLRVKKYTTLRPLFTNFLTSVLTYKLCNPQDDWLDWLIRTHPRTDYIIQGVKSLVN